MLQKRYPFITLPAALVLLRICIAGLFLAHAVVRLVTGTVGRFGDFLNNRGWVYGLPLVWAITAFELAGGLLLLLGYATRWVATGFIVLLVMGIIIIHAREGWFNGEFGTGGCEYSVSLIAGLLVVASAGAPRKKIDPTTHK